MTILYCWLSVLVLCAIIPVCHGEHKIVKQKPTIEEKIRKKEMFVKRQTEDVKEKSGHFVMQFVGPDDAAVKLGEEYGFKLDKKILKEYITFTDGEKRSQDQLKKAIGQMKYGHRNQVKSFYEEKWIRQEKFSVTPQSLNVTDEYWSKQWHLQPLQSPSHEVYEAWERGYTGKGVVIAIVDDGVDTTHGDLVDTYNASLSANFVFYATGGIHIYQEDGHGTKCAGIAAAAKNDKCVIGVAYEATFASLRILDGNYATYSSTADALTHKPDEIDIYSCSWGHGSYGYGYYALDKLEEAALIQGVTEGRNGKGAIYLFSAGNSGDAYDDCNASGYVTSVYTIGVNAMNKDGSRANYAEECTAVMVATYGGELDDNNADTLIATTARNDMCIDDFFGTSASSPIAAGIIAFVLQANPELTWRDIQYLIAETSSYDGVPGEIHQTNAAGKNVSLVHGFGVMKAIGMIDAAKTWKTVPGKIVCDGDTVSVHKCCTDIIESTYDLQNCHIKYAEHVQVHVFFEALWREYTEMHILSPRGTDSRILRQRKADYEYSPVEWTFMTLFNWGEDPRGNWTIRMKDHLTCQNEINLYTWRVIVHGTITDPHAGVPANGTLGGHCDTDVPCDGGLDCLLSGHLCAPCDIKDFRIVNGFCARDRKTGGYCDGNNICVDENSWCNANNSCEVCDSGFRRYYDHNACYEDTKLHGYCDDESFCSEPDVGCNALINRCINCSNGYHVQRGYCVEDGTVNGYCDAETPCQSEVLGCSPSDGWCVYCFDPKNAQHIIDGFCMDDGTMGGYCNDTVVCTEDGSGCDHELNMCISCSYEGFHIIDRICRQDGNLDGYCNETVLCSHNLGCDPGRQVCVECSNPGYRVVGDGSCRQDGDVGGYCDASIACRGQKSGCIAENNTCVICYAGHHMLDGFCVKGRYSKVATTPDDTGLSGGVIAGSLIGGIASGIAITAPAFFIMMKKILAVKIKPNIQNGNSHFSSDKKGNNGFVNYH